MSFGQTNPVDIKNYSRMENHTFYELLKRVNFVVRLSQKFFCAVIDVLREKALDS